MDDMYVPRNQRTLAGNILLWIIGALLVLGALGAIFFGVRWVTAGPKGKLQAREQIQSGNSRIQAYDHFYNLCASVQALEFKLDAQYNERAAATGSDLERVNANITGLTGTRGEAIAQYNADARKSYTIGQFRASDLPYQLDTSPYDYVKGAKTSCA